jgi:putative Mn2+ efflux pump MntP
MEFFDTTNTAESLMASVGTSTASTVANLTPIVAVIGGIILAFIGIRYIVSLVKSTGRAK